MFTTMEKVMWSLLAIVCAFTILQGFNAMHTLNQIDLSKVVRNQ